MGFLSNIGDSLSSSIGGGLFDIAGTAISGYASYKSAQQQMDFQKKMSNTAHQREVKDLRKAGLNPILSAKLGGSSSPGGASWGVPQLTGVMNNAQSAKKTKAEAEGISDLMYWQAAQSRTNSALNSQNYNKAVWDTKTAEQISKQEKMKTQVVAEESKKQIEALQTETKIEKSRYGEALRWLNRLNPFSNSAGSLMRSVPK